ncbi:Thymus-specific serine protease [Perkinsus chesapeaki]|uniref:Thymus-specific serine protease n=1 Tax=Perkinsus chesapeaki TaxID=330153 RepID=A0A7J6M1W9_PERCH|nr:Thymus-specific serine protease [Perkinsus chesapeaki]
MIHIHASHVLLSLLLLPYCSGVPSLVFDQLVDHFGGSGTFKQRYIYSDKFVTTAKSQLVIIHIRGEAGEKEMSDFPLDVFHLGFNTKSIVASLEHRFYGQSLPSTSPTTSDLNKLLTIKQSIADIVTFREYLVKKYALTGPKFVLMGCSYAGSLAAWARVQHPDLFLGAIASCPVIDLKYDFPEYQDAVGAAFAQPSVGGSPACLAFIKRASGIIKAKLSTLAGRRELETVFGLRGNYLEDARTRQLWLDRSTDLNGTQSNNPFCSKDLCNIEKKCKFVASSDVSSEENALKVFTRIGTQLEQPKKLQSYSTYISWLKERSNIDQRRFQEFQICTQWVLFISCNLGSNCPFVQSPALLAIKQALCQDAFGLSQSDIKKKIAETMKDFGGRSLKKTGNIVVILGQMDPWKAAGEVDTSVVGVIKYEVPKASHCFWTKRGSTELPGVKEVLTKTVVTVQSWLKATDTTLGSEPGIARPRILL